MDFYKHYVFVSDSGLILSGWSDGVDPERDISGAVCINSAAGYQFRLFPGSAENPVLLGEYGVPLYRWDGASVQKRNSADVAADIAKATEEDIPAESYTEKIASLEKQIAQQQALLNALLGG